MSRRALVASLAIVLFPGWILIREWQDRREFRELRRTQAVANDRLDLLLRQQDALAELLAGIGRAVDQSGRPPQQGAALAAVAAPDPAVRAPVPPPPRTVARIDVSATDAAAALEHAQSLIDSALARGTWTEDDRRQFSAERWKLAKRDIEVLIHRVVIAANTGKLDIAQVRGRLF
jgi:hypothetical protein